MKSGNINFLETYGLLQACNGIALFFTILVFPSSLQWMDEINNRSSVGYIHLPLSRKPLYYSTRSAKESAQTGEIKNNTSLRPTVCFTVAIIYLYQNARQSKQIRRHGPCQTVAYSQLFCVG